eukprot:CAMPEP_0172811506 /NCGR_PEP_ID=MMETSP1075-20121228/9456_1 /TAXON_ID=2916 /ORGANISM="Ceratium fusus, Strain PA161109" /LENGTH=232 /DNA_ID=CAMNT_0013650937 /DNA_START=44 /DNA_END=742 /DNA_ORIENTATION=+
MASSSPGNPIATTMPHHQVWGQLENLAELSSSSENRLQRISNIPEVNWHSSSEKSHGSQSAPLVSSEGAVPSSVNVQPQLDLGREDLPSIGSRLHATGRCKQCYHINLPGGCEKGAACGFCHLHTKKCRLRPSKAVRAHAKSQAQVLDTINDVEEMKNVAEVLISQTQCRYTHEIVKKKLLTRGVPLPTSMDDEDSSSLDGKSGNSHDFEDSALSNKPQQKASKPKRNIVRL